jgi:S1-C subfamily serine protease
MNCPFGRQRPPHWRGFFRGAAPVAVALVASLLAGCAGSAIDESDWERRTMKLLQGRKETSQSSVNGDRIESTTAAGFLNARTALLLGGRGKFTAQVQPDGRSMVVGWEAQPGHDGVGVASAAAISEDGYFLTAAHGVTPSAMKLVRTSGRGPDLAAARLVWKGDPARGGPDLALIHAPVSDQPFFELAGAGPVPARSRVWTGGFGDVRQNQARGWLREVGPWQRGADRSAWRTLGHTAPLMRGDSGGPLVDRAGRLLGVNTEFLVQPASLLGFDHLRVYRPLAVGADPGWIADLVAQDRTARRATDRPRPRR